MAAQLQVSKAALLLSNVRWHLVSSGIKLNLAQSNLKFENQTGDLKCEESMIPLFASQHAGQIYSIQESIYFLKGKKKKICT